MSDIVACPSCDRKLRIREELQGYTVKCPSCETTFKAEMPPPPDPPRPVEVEEEEHEEPRPRRARLRYDEHEEDDDRPRRRRRRYDDYAPHRGVLVLVLGVCGVMGIFWPITSVIAWVLGASDLRAIRAGDMDPEGESMTRVGWILGIVGTLLFTLIFVFVCAIIGLAVMFGK